MGNTIFLPFGAVVEQARCTEKGASERASARSNGPCWVALNRSDERPMGSAWPLAFAGVLSLLAGLLSYDFVEL